MNKKYATPTPKKPRGKPVTRSLNEVLDFLFRGDGPHCLEEECPASNYCSERCDCRAAWREYFEEWNPRRGMSMYEGYSARTLAFLLATYTTTCIDCFQVDRCAQPDGPISTRSACTRHIWHWLTDGHNGNAEQQSTSLYSRMSEEEQKQAARDIIEEFIASGCDREVILRRTEELLKQHPDDE